MNDINDFYFSYSAVNTYETCKHQFKLSYLDRQERVGNFFSDFGSLIHVIMEKYFNGELEIYELYDYYKDEYFDNIKNPPPSFMPNAFNSYFDAGAEFFKNFDFDKSNYEMVNIEEYVRGSDRGINLVIKPDLILRNKSDGEVIIFDFKTSEIVNRQGKVDREKLNGYKNQLNLYIHYIWLFKDINIAKAKLWFIRSNTFYEWNYDPYDSIDTQEWFIKTANKIKKETDWSYNNRNQFMCNVLCGVREACRYRK